MRCLSMIWTIAHKGVFIFIIYLFYESHKGVINKIK